MLKDGGVPLFQGSGAKTVYARCTTRFNKVVNKELVNDLRSLGFSKGDLASHSCRKQVASWVASECTVSPPIVSLCLRAGWVHWIYPNWNDAKRM